MLCVEALFPGHEPKMSIKEDPAAGGLSLHPVTLEELNLSWSDLFAHKHAARSEFFSTVGETFRIRVASEHRCTTCATRPQVSTLAICVLDSAILSANFAEDADLII